MDPNQMPQPSPEMGPGMPQMSGMPMPPMPPAPDPSATPQMPLPEMEDESAIGPDMEEANELMSAPSDKEGNGMKKELLKKMMSNLLNKPGRSVNEMINGVKAVIGAYKNYAKEWDALNGMAEKPMASSNAPSSGSGDEIQKILRSVQQKKAASDGSGGPGMMQPQQMAPLPSPSAMPQNNGYRAPAPIAHLGILGY